MNKEKINKLLNSLWLHCKYGYVEYIGGYLPSANDSIDVFKKDLSKFIIKEKHTPAKKRDDVDKSYTRGEVGRLISEIKDCLNEVS